MKLESFRERAEKAEEPGEMKSPDAEKEEFLLLRTRNIAAGIDAEKGCQRKCLNGDFRKY